MSKEDRKWPLSWPDTIMFFGGLALTIHHTVVGREDRPALTALFAAMMGLAWARSADRKRQEDGT